MSGDPSSTASPVLLIDRASSTEPISIFERVFVRKPVMGEEV